MNSIPQSPFQDLPESIFSSMVVAVPITPVNLIMRYFVMRIFLLLYLFLVPFQCQWESLIDLKFQQLLLITLYWQFLLVPQHLSDFLIKLLFREQMGMHSHSE